MQTALENWNYRARKYGYDAVGVIGTKNEVQEAQYAQTKKFLKDKLPQDKSVLDYGCGVGRLSELFNPELYTGIDISPEMLKIARKTHPEYTFLDLGEIPETDIFFTANVLQHNGDSFVQGLQIPAKELYLYELIGTGEDKQYLFHRTVKDYERLLGLKCQKKWKNKSHTLMYYVNHS